MTSNNYLLTRILEVSLTTPSTVADVFVQYSPHVGILSVQVYLGGWNAEVDAFKFEADAFDTESVVRLYDGVMKVISHERIHQLCDKNL